MQTQPIALQPPAYSPDRLRALVRPDRVHRSVYTDPVIFDLEMREIFGRAWVFVGHDSQIPRPHDFVASRIGAEAGREAVIAHLREAARLIRRRDLVMVNHAGLGHIGGEFSILDVPTTL